MPQLEVLEHSDVFITHGGMNSVNEGIHFNVPLVVMPHDKDQPMVAQRLSELQAGYTISKDEVNAQLLKQGIEEVLQNDQYLEGIKRINQSFQECMDMDEVMERIDQLIHQKTK